MLTTGSQPAKGV